jgi:hypothetical protein
MAQQPERRSFAGPDEARDFPNGTADMTSGHDAWVMGDEPVVVVDWFRAGNYAK